MNPNNDRFIVTVSQVNHRVGLSLKKDTALNELYVRGEVSNFVRHYKSGHIYFTLKDDESALKCVMFALDAERLTFTPENGKIIIAGGRIGVYERDGVYQLYAASLEPEKTETAAEEGQLAQFIKLKDKLNTEGIFKNNRPLPRYPKKICLVTSRDGAALQDMLSVFARRYPLLEVLLIPALMQGENAPSSVINALKAAQKEKPDIIIIARGGGSAEDLWAFNDEMLARAVHGSKIPVVAAIGHETDFALIEFAADLRAPTPTAAAELSVPDMSGFIVELENLLVNFKQKIYRIIDRKLTRLENIEKVINALNPERAFARGYAAVFDSGGGLVRSADNINIGEQLNIRLQNGGLSVIVKELK